MKPQIVISEDVNSTYKYDLYDEMGDIFLSGDDFNSKEELIEFLTKLKILISESLQFNRIST